MLLLLSWLGCQQDLLLVLGDVTGVGSAVEVGLNTENQDPLLEIAFEQPSGQIIAEPLQPVMPTEGDTPGVGGELREGDTVRASSRPPSEFNPISVPQGPIEGTGVRWDGVKSKSNNYRGPGSHREFPRR